MIRLADVSMPVCRCVSKKDSRSSRGALLQSRLSWPAGLPFVWQLAGRGSIGRHTSRDIAYAFVTAEHKL
jgi:hypothetical protein